MGAGGLVTFDDLERLVPDLIATAAQAQQVAARPAPQLFLSTATVDSVGNGTVDVQFDDDEPGVLATVQGSAAIGDRVPVLHNGVGGAIVVGTTGQSGGSDGGTGAPFLAGSVANRVTAPTALQASGTATTAAAWVVQSSRGIAPTPTALANTDQLGSYGFGGFGTAWNTLASLQAQAAEDFTATAGGTNVSLFTTPIGSIAPAEVQRWNANGSSTFFGTVNGGTSSGDNLELSANQSSNLNFAGYQRGWIASDSPIVLYGQNPTFTDRGYFFAIEGTTTITLDNVVSVVNPSGAADAGDFLQYTPTIVLKKSGGTNGFLAGLNYGPKAKNDPAVAANFSPSFALISSFHLTADTQTGISVGNGKEVWLRPTFQTINGGTITAGQHDHLTMDLTLNAGVSIAQRRGLVINAATGAGTVTTEIGIYNALQTQLVGKLTVGAASNFVVNASGNFVSVGNGATLGDFYVGDLTTALADFWVDATTSTTTIRGTLDLTAATIVGLPGAFAFDSTVYTATGATLTGTIRADSTTAAPALVFQRLHSTAAVLSGDQLGSVQFQGLQTGTTYAAGATIRGVADGTSWDATHRPGRLELLTSPAGSGAVVRALIDNAGTFYVGATAGSAVTSIDQSGNLTLSGITVLGAPADPTVVRLAVGGSVLATGGFLGLDFIATEFGGGCASLDTRGVSGPSIAANTANPANMKMGAWHVGGSDGTAGVLRDVAAIVARTTQNWVAGSAYGTAWDIFTQPASAGASVSGGELAATFGADKSLTVQGNIASATGNLAVYGSTTTGPGGNVTLFDGQVNVMPATFTPLILRRDTTGAAPAIQFQRLHSTTFAQAGDALGQIDFAGAEDGTPVIGNAARIVVKAPAAFSPSSTPGRIEFWNTAISSTTLALSAALANDGTFYIAPTITANVVSASTASITAAGVGTFVKGAFSTNAVVGASTFPAGISSGGQAFNVVGGIHVADDASELTYIGTGLNFASTIDLRRVNATYANFVASTWSAVTAGQNLGGMHIGATTPGFLYDCASFYCAAVTDFSDTANGATGRTETEWNFNTSPNAGPHSSQLLALKIRSDQGITVTGTIVGAAPTATSGNVPVIDGSTNIATGSVVLQRAAAQSTIDLRRDDAGAAAAGTNLGGLNGWGTTAASTFRAAGTVRFVADGAFAANTSPSRVELLTVAQGSGGATAVNLALDSAGALHLVPTITSGRVAGSVFAVKADGSLWIAPTAYTSNQPSAAPATISAAGAAAFASLTLVTPLAAAQGGTGATSLAAMFLIDGTANVASTGTFSLAAPALSAGNLQFVRDNNAAIASGNVLWTLMFRGSTDAAHTIANAASVRGVADAAFGAGSAPGRLELSTTPTGSTTIAVRALIDQAGKLWIGATAAAALASIDQSGNLMVSGTTIFPPSTVQALVAATTISPNATVIHVTSVGVITLTATPTITAGTDGQILTIVNDNTTAARTITFQSNDTLAGSNLSLNGTSAAIGPRGQITLVYSAALTRWVQVGLNLGGH